MLKNTTLAFFCLCTLLVAACIPVGDFGAYWDKGAVDTVFLGQWEKEQPKGATADKASGSITVTSEDGAYLIDSLDENVRREKDYAPMTAKTLKAGRYTFLMVREKEKTSGDLVRYKIKGRTLQEYSLETGKMSQFLKKKFPGANNFKPDDCKTKCWFHGVNIKTFDDEVYEILKAIPDTQEYWKPDDRYRRRGK